MISRLPNWAGLPIVAAGAVLVSAASLTPLDQAIEAYRAGKMAEARILAEPLAVSGDPKAAALVGFLYEQGLGVEEDDARATAFYRTAAAKEDPDALVALGRFGLNNRGHVSLTEAQAFLSRAAKAGRTDAASLLGTSMLTGRFGKRDPEGAAAWLGKAADGGDVEAAYALAILQLEGDGVPKNEVGALIRLKFAADNGHAAAMADYGLLIYQGKAGGGAPSKSSAANWFEKSAKAGDAEGQFLYAYALATGQGVARDPIAAYVWLLRSSAKVQSGAPEYDQDRAKLKAGLEKLLRPDEIAKAATEAQKPIGPTLK